MEYEHVLSPIRIRGLELPNRVVFPPMGTLLCDDESFVTPALIAYHRARAAGGCGLNWLEVTNVYKEARPRCFASLSEDKYVPRMTELVDAVHAVGGRIGVQLWQDAMGVFRDRSVRKLSASETVTQDGQFVPALEKDEIAEIIEAYGQAARRAVEAGFDAIMIHGAHSYLLHNFLSPGTNHRDDEYGGSLENCRRFPHEVIARVRREMPDDMPLFYRVSVFDEGLENGLTAEQVIDFVKTLPALGVDVVSCSRGNKLNYGAQAGVAIESGVNVEIYSIPPIDIPRGINVPYAAAIRRETGMLVSVAGRINDPDLAESVIAEGSADLVDMGRAQICDPEFVNKMKAGRVDDIRRCVACDQGCAGAFSNLALPHVSCMLNPTAGRELSYVLRPVDRSLDVMVAGSGVAALEAAITLRERGHRPTIFEATATLGGTFVLAGAAPRKSEMADYVHSRLGVARRAGIPLHTDTPVTPELIARRRPDVVIAAIGAQQLEPPISGLDLPHVHRAHDVLSGAAQPQGRVAVIGGGLVGLETAELLAERGCTVTVLEMQPQIGEGLTPARRVLVMRALREAGVNVRTDVQCGAVTHECVVISTRFRVDTLPCDAVVLAVGARARGTGTLEAMCDKLGIPFYSVGDCVRARFAMDAIGEAAKLARLI